MSDMTLGVALAEVQEAYRILGDHLPTINVTLYDDVLSVHVDEATYRLHRESLLDTRATGERRKLLEYRGISWVHLYLDVSPTLVLHTCFKEVSDG